MMALNWVKKKAKEALLGDGTVEPYKCKICHKWVKHASKAKWVCPKCYEELE